MTLEDEIFEKYSKIGYVSGNEFYFDKQTAFDFLNECNEKYIAVIGVDFYHIVNKKILPVIPDNGLDCSMILEEIQEWKKIIQSCNSIILDVLQIEFIKDNFQYCSMITIEEDEWNN